MKLREKDLSAHPYYRRCAMLHVISREEEHMTFGTPLKDTCEVQTWACCMIVVGACGVAMGMHKMPLDHEFVEDLKQEVLDFVTQRLKEYQQTGSTRN
jgi:hypothetical protein